MKEKKSNEWKQSKKLQQMHLERLLPTRTDGLQAAFFFFKPPANHSKINFPFSNVFPLLLLLFSCSLLFLDVEPSEMPRILPISSVVTPTEYLHLKFLKPLSTLSLKCLLYQKLPSASTPPHFSSTSALESPAFSLGTPAYSTPPSVTRWAAAPHKSTIAYLSRIHMDSRWVAINPKTGGSS